MWSIKSPTLVFGCCLYLLSGLPLPGVTTHIAARPLTLHESPVEARITDSDGHFEIRYAQFATSDGLEEYHITLQAHTIDGPFENQLAAIDRAYAHALRVLGLDTDTAVLRRFYCSDPANQSAILKAHPLGDNEAPCVISIVGQAPLSIGKIALCAYHLQ